MTGPSAVAVALPPGWRLVHHPIVGSTNTVAREMGDQGAPDRTVVWADQQSAGRARRGRVWSSPKGNLYASLLLRPSTTASKAALLTFVASLALAESLGDCAPDLVVQLKWPNDLMVGGKKLSGLLLEAGGQTSDRVDYVVIGSGINIAHFPADAERPTTSLCAEGVIDLTPAALLAAYLTRFETLYTDWQTYGFSAIRKRWLGKAAGVGGPITVRLEREQFDGVFQALDDDGALVCALSDGTLRTVTVGDLFLPNPPHRAAP